MNVAVAGGGPGGLYAALLIKKGHPDWDVSLYEKNTQGATYGWGVVFSDRTLTSFRESDFPTYESIVDTFVTWDAIDIRFKDEVVRCWGQGFSGISRRKLLGILHDRCLELGVDLHYSTEISGAGALSAHDLIVAADGVHSAFRSANVDRFSSSFKHGRARYIWFGTTRPFDSFTFIFRTNEHGLFQAHAYPFDASMGTFIVECTEETWKKAGLDSADEGQSISYCEKLFAPELAGHPLRSNASRWISFVTVRNKRWRAGPVVLLGDSAHTAHFSIGSGTKLAMEDAIALARALETHSDVAGALADYELERRPRVERFQDAARQSQTYFENTHRYMHLEPQQFAFHLLTRSGRVDYNSLRLGDRFFVGRVDSWFAKVVGAAPPPAFVPLSLGPARLRNRIVVGTAPTYSAREGMPGDGVAHVLARAAATGAGLIVTDTVAVSAGARITPGCTGIYDSEQAERWRELLAAIVGHSAIAVRLGHAGRRGATHERHRGIDRPLSDAWALLAPTALPYMKRARTPKAMDERDMNDVIDDFVAAARFAERAGFNALIVDMSHGYLLGSFLSPLTNHRRDGYGGDPRRRARFPLDVLRAIREVWPRDRALGASLSATDWARGGTTVAQSVAVSQWLHSGGADFIEVRAGQTVAGGRPRYDPYYLISYSDRIRNEAHVATLATGAIPSVDDMNTILAAGRADLCMLLNL
jgi:anthraniloyl-CoA monooxygenase